MICAVSDTTAVLKSEHGTITLAILEAPIVVGSQVLQHEVYGSWLRM